MIKVIRWVIIIILVGISICIQKKANSKKAWYFILVIAILTTLIPFENLFMRFSSPENAFRYFTGNQKVDVVVVGENSALVSGKKDLLIVPKIKEHYKLDLILYTKIVSQTLTDDGAIYVYYNKNSDDYYACVISIDQNDLRLTDTLGSKFIKSPNTDVATYYAYISSFDPNYCVTINNRQYSTHST